MRPNWAARLSTRRVEQPVRATELIDDDVAFLVDDVDLNEVKRPVGRRFAERYGGRLTRSDDLDDRCGAQGDAVRLARILGQAVPRRPESAGHGIVDVQPHPVERDATGIVHDGDGEVEAVAVPRADGLEHVPSGPDRHAGAGGVVGTRRC